VRCSNGHHRSLWSNLQSRSLAHTSVFITSVFITSTIISAAVSVSHGYERSTGTVDDRCDVFRTLDSVDLPTEFWEKYGQIAATATKADLDALVKKYLPEGGLGSSTVTASVGANRTTATSASSTIGASALVPSRLLQFSKAFERSYRKLPDTVLRRKVDGFLTIAREGGWEKIFEASKSHPSWDMHMMKPHELNKWRIRLSDGDRLVFRRNPDNSIEVLDLGNNIYRH
jgi:hypothetical protein